MAFEFATFEGLGQADQAAMPGPSASFGQAGQETTWSPTVKRATIAVAAVLGGLLLIAAVSRANVCPKLQRRYTDNWLNHGYGLAEWTQREAAARGCKWALARPVDVMRDQG